MHINALSPWPRKYRAEPPRADIIDAEETLHAKVQARAAADLTKRSASRPMTADLDEQLISLRDSINEAKPEDLAPLVEQMTRLAALRSQLGSAQTLPIDTDSPYFAHMRLREGKRIREVLIGKRGFIDRKENIQIVDWRNAPISRIYYRYDEGDDYEEEIAGRLVDGIVETRRNLSISKADASSNRLAARHLRSRPRQGMAVCEWRSQPNLGRRFRNRCPCSSANSKAGCEGQTTPWKPTRL